MVKKVNICFDIENECKNKGLFSSETGLLYVE